MAVESTVTWAAGLKPTPPLHVNPPSPMMIIQYPLFAANVRILCDKEFRQSRGASSLGTAFVNIRKTYSTEGALGVYRGAHLYLLHQVTRDVLKMLSERGWRWVERKQGQQHNEEGGEIVLTKRQYRMRLATKYFIDVACYPLLLASTRAIVLHDDPASCWQHMCAWRRDEGLLSWYGGLFASLLSTALDEVMDWVLAWCIDYCSKDNDVELADRLLLKASGSSVVGIFTAPVNYVGVIQRCQSTACRLPDPEPVPELVKSLPWRGCVWQIALYGGIMALNIKLIQVKIQLRDQQ